MVTEFLKEQNIETQEPTIKDPESKLWIKHSEIVITTEPVIQVTEEKLDKVIPVVVSQTSDVLDSSKETKKNLVHTHQVNFESLIELHQKFLILGVENLDQPNFSEGFANFNYVSEAEMNYCAKKMLELGIESFPRENKPCNLTFELSFPNIEIPKQKVKRRFEDVDLIPAVIWVLKKNLRTAIITDPTNKGTIDGISTRGVLHCSKHDLILAKEHLKKNFRICILIETGDLKKSEFFVLTNEKTRKICQENKHISIKELIEKIKPIRKARNMKNGISNLSTEVANLLIENGFKYFGYSRKGEERESNQIYLSHKKLKDGGGFKICPSLGTKEEKIVAAKKILDILQAVLTLKGKTFIFTLVKSKTRVIVLEKTNVKESPVNEEIEKVISTVTGSHFFKSLTKEQKELLVSELGIETIDVSSVVDEIGKNFLFINKKNPFVAGLNQSVFASAKEVISKTSQK